MNVRWRTREEAIAMIDEERSWPALLDLLMPRKDGFAVLQHVKKRQYAFFFLLFSRILSDEMDDERCRNWGEGLFKSDMDEDELWLKISVYLS